MDNNSTASDANTQRRRQQRLLLSCSECRRRKIRCDRATPCRACVRSERAERCHYDTLSTPRDRTIPGQYVFAAGPTQQEPAHAASVPAPEQPNGPSEDHVRPPQDVVSPLQQFWHGSRSGDQYVSPFNLRTITVPKEVVFGDNDATVYWGRSHETNFVPRITDMTSLLLKSDEESDVPTLYQVERSTRPKEGFLVAMDPELLLLVPQRATADRLWLTYREHFESYYQILHLPTFEKEYQQFWTSQQGPPHFLAQLLSICAIASCFRDEDRLRQEGAVRAWIEDVRLWLFKQSPRAQMTLGFLQAHLLMLVAGDVHWMKIDRSWISSGILIRNAISAGLHREPRDFTRISPFYAELRRRLWYSMLEYDLQASFAKGRIPFVKEEEYDCELPDRSFDDFLDGNSRREATRSPSHVARDMYSIGGPITPQVNIVLARSVALRSKLCQAVNSIKLSLDYDEVLRLDAELRAFTREMSTASDGENTFFKKALSKILSQRAVIALHAPFVARSLNDPKWVYSRTRCLQTARTVLQEALYLLEERFCGDFGPFATITNICRCEVSNSIFLICHELLTQAAEQRGLTEYSLLTSNGSAQQRRDLVDLVERICTGLTQVCKSDIVSQRTSAWVQLSVELCRAAARCDDTTISSVREAIRKSIHTYRSNIQAQGDGDPVQTAGILNDVMPPGAFEGAMDEDYFNLFLDLNSMGGFE